MNERKTSLGSTAINQAMEELKNSNEDMLVAKTKQIYSKTKICLTKPTIYIKNKGLLSKTSHIYEKNKFYLVEPRLSLNKPRFT